MNDHFPWVNPDLDEASKTGITVRSHLVSATTIGTNINYPAVIIPC